MGMKRLVQPLTTVLAHCASLRILERWPRSRTTAHRLSRVGNFNTEALRTQFGEGYSCVSRVTTLQWAKV
eukprot:2799393-Rhodomonas_salina.1